MESGQRPDAIDTRVVYRAYAIGMALLGAVLAAWGPLWISIEFAGPPLLGASLVRMTGALLIAFACFAMPLVDLDPPARRRALLWLTGGHGVILAMLAAQRIAIWGPGPADWAAALLNSLVLAFLYLWFTAEGEKLQPGPVVSSLFGKKSRSSTERLRSQYEQQIREAAGQEERNRLARDLHDSIKQQIFVVQTAAATAQVRFEEDPAGAKAALDQVRGSAREAMTEMEAMLDQLRAEPLENIGLVEALKKQCEALEFRTGARVRLDVGTLPPSNMLYPGTQQAIFRVAQEALANVARHARARNVAVHLGSAAGQFELKIQDDGAGFDSERGPRGMGIANMRARAEELGGTLELNTRPGGGASITLSIPYTVVSARDYLWRALSYSVALIFFARLSDSGDWGLPFAFAAVAAVGLVREAVAYLRLRRLEETP